MNVICAFQFLSKKWSEFASVEWLIFLVDSRRIVWCMHFGAVHLWSMRAIDFPLLTNGSAVLASRVLGIGNWLPPACRAGARHVGPVWNWYLCRFNFVRVWNPSVVTNFNSVVTYGTPYHLFYEANDHSSNMAKHCLFVSVDAHS